MNATSKLFSTLTFFVTSILCILLLSFLLFPQTVFLYHWIFSCIFHTSLDGSVTKSYLMIFLSLLLSRRLSMVLLQRATRWYFSLLLLSRRLLMVLLQRATWWYFSLLSFPDVSWWFCYKKLPDDISLSSPFHTSLDGSVTKSYLMIFLSLLLSRRLLMVLLQKATWWYFSLFSFPDVSWWFCYKKLPDDISLSSPFHTSLDGSVTKSYPMIFLSLLLSRRLSMVLLQRATWWYFSLFSFPDVSWWFCYKKLPDDISLSSPFHTSLDGSVTKSYLMIFLSLLLSRRLSMILLQRATWWYFSLFSFPDVFRWFCYKELPDDISLSSPFQTSPDGSVTKSYLMIFLSLLLSIRLSMVLLQRATWWYFSLFSFPDVSRWFCYKELPDDISLSSPFQTSFDGSVTKSYLMIYLSLLLSRRLLMVLLQKATWWYFSLFSFPYVSRWFCYKELPDDISLSSPFQTSLDDSVTKSYLVIFLSLLLSRRLSMVLLQRATWWYFSLFSFPDVSWWQCHHQYPDVRARGWGQQLHNQLCSREQCVRWHARADLESHRTLWVLQPDPVGVNRIVTDICPYFCSNGGIFVDFVYDFYFMLSLLTFLCEKIVFNDRKRTIVCVALCLHVLGINYKNT